MYATRITDFGFGKQRWLIAVISNISTCNPLILLGLSVLVEDISYYNRRRTVNTTEINFRAGRARDMQRSKLFCGLGRNNPSIPGDPVVPVLAPHGYRSPLPEAILHGFKRSNG